jgi:hypothetical protein
MATTPKAAARKPAATKPASKKPAARKPAARAAAAASVETQRRELAAIKRRAKALSASLTADSLDADGNPTGAWKEMLAELDAWAKRHKVKLKTIERDSAEGVAGDRVPRSQGMCLGTHSVTERTDFVGGGHITITTTCTFKRRTILTGRCVYSCVAEIVGLHIV